MADADKKTLEMVTGITRTASRLAQRMGGVYVLHPSWQARIHLCEGRKTEEQTAAQG